MIQNLRLLLLHLRFLAKRLVSSEPCQFSCNRPWSNYEQMDESMKGVREGAGHMLGKMAQQKLRSYSGRCTPKGDYIQHYEWYEMVLGGEDCSESTQEILATQQAWASGQCVPLSTHLLTTCLPSSQMHSFESGAIKFTDDQFDQWVLKEAGKKRSRGPAPVTSLRQSLATTPGCKAQKCLKHDCGAALRSITKP